MPNNIYPLKLTTTPAFRIFCFPYAGASAYAFQPWINIFPGYCELYSVRIPREQSGHVDSSFSTIQKMSLELATEIEPLLDVPFVFWGHSMGGLIAFELARKLQQYSKCSPELFVVSSSIAPQETRNRLRLSHLDDKSFIAKINEFGGFHEDILNDSELMELIMPRLRADMLMVDEYQYVEMSKLPSPILGLYGADDKYVSSESCYAWKHQTASKFICEEFHGGHFFINKNKSEICKFILNVLHLVTTEPSLVL